MYCLDAVRIAAGTEDDESAEDMDFSLLHGRAPRTRICSAFSVHGLTYLLKCLFP